MEPRRASQEAAARPGDDDNRHEVRRRIKVFDLPIDELRYREEEVEAGLANGAGAAAAFQPATMPIPGPLRERSAASTRRWIVFSTVGQDVLHDSDVHLGFESLLLR